MIEQLGLMPGNTENIISPTTTIGNLKVERHYHHTYLIGKGDFGKPNEMMAGYHPKSLEELTVKKEAEAVDEDEMIHALLQNMKELRSELDAVKQFVAKTLERIDDRERGARQQSCRT